MAVGAEAGLPIVTVTGVLALSQLPGGVWLTYQVVVPAEVVEGTGAVGLPVPLVATVYQSRLLPVAVNAVAAAFWQ